MPRLPAASPHPKPVDLFKAAIDYSSPRAPRTLRTARLGLYSTPVYCIRTSKTNNPENDWQFNPGCRAYGDRTQGFDFETRNKRFRATVWLPIDPEDVTCAEENDPGTVTVAEIHRQR